MRIEPWSYGWIWTLVRYLYGVLNELPNTRNYFDTYPINYYYYMNELSRTLKALVPT